MSDSGEITLEAFQDLEKRLAKTEKKLEKAKARAQATNQEMWTVDRQLKEVEDRASAAEAKLAELEGSTAGEPSAELSEEAAELRTQLDEALAEAAKAAALSTELTELQEQLKTLTAERSEERVNTQAQIAQLENRLADSSTGGEDQSRVAELESEIEALRAQLSEAPPKSVDEELAQARIDGLRVALQEAEDRAIAAENAQGGLDSSSADVKEQLAELQRKVGEAEAQAVEWEERYKVLEERVEVDGPAQPAGEESEAIAALETELASARSWIAELESGATPASEDGEASASELEEHKQRIADLEAQLAAAGEATGEGVAPSAESDPELLERATLAEELAEALREQAAQAAQNHQDAIAELEQTKTQLEETKSSLTETEAKLAEAEAKSAPGGVAGISLSATDSGGQLAEAVQRTRDAELKANQAEIQLQKAMQSLHEYEQKANEKDRETQRLAFQDALTGLPNLNLIRQYLEFTVTQVQRYNRASALLVVDLDRFKLINDAMGFKAGDMLLVKVAERLQTAIRESDALGRKGEDEFLILLSELFTGDDTVPPEQKTNMIRQNIAIVVNRISECLSRPFNIQGQKFYIRASIGVSICPNDADSAQAMLEHADSAMYHAKDSGRGRCVFYNSELHKRQERRLTLDSQLRLAMEKGEFVLLYQPIIEITKGKGTIVGVEALLRWNHRIDGLLKPDSFLQIAEETGLIVQLGQWVCRQACWQLRQWLGEGHNLFVSFNVSTRQILQADLADVILASVEEFGLQPGLVFVEISEGSNSEEVELIERVITNLGRTGIRICIDDFGVGYSSLSRIDLKHIQFLKVDPSLVSGCHSDKAKANICEAAVKLAQSLELRPLAEGVESAAQAKFLSKVGCQFMQGYFLQEPASAAVIGKILNEKRVWKF